MPLPVISIAQMRDWEQATWATGQTEIEVIRRVGRVVARHALGLTRPGDLILILAGKGHNGEDATAAREHLTERRVDVLAVTDPAEDLARLKALLSLRPALVIDGLFGIGINRPLNSAWCQFIHCVNAAGAQVLAVDAPSGLNADTGQPQGAAIQAAVTLTVGAPKTGLLAQAAWPYVGRLEVTGNVGLVPCPLSAEGQWTLPEDFAGYPPPRVAATHKGSYGHLGILAGSLGYHGAAVLTARGAQRAQPGLITLFTFPAVYVPIAAQLQAVMVAPWQANTRLPDSWDAVLVGPGLAAAEMPEQMKLLVRHLWQTSPLPLVADASALDWLPPGPVPEAALRVITPHPGEAARLLGSSADQVQANRLASLRALSARFGHAWVVLKGHQTLIGRSSGVVFVNSSGNPHLAQGGSGDVLSGFIAGLLTQSHLQSDPGKTLGYAAWQHGATADRLQASRPPWVVEDLVEALGRQEPTA
ncbi:MAG TPA: NAD(P)H-hydrate dehydratase [Candidatus Sulfotelmatobacter sp.]|nr:NAD(P)H-hydrate dehydratase [Candidatus Sulfotelmatobacter sp.]